MCRLTQYAHSRSCGLIVPSWSRGAISERELSAINVLPGSLAERFTSSPPCLTSTTPERTGTLLHITASIPILLRVGLSAATHPLPEVAKLLVIVEPRTQAGCLMAMVCCRHLSTKARHLRRARGHYPSLLLHLRGVYPSFAPSMPLRRTWDMDQNRTEGKDTSLRSGNQRRSE